MFTVAGSIDDKVGQMLSRLAFFNENILHRIHWQTELAVIEAVDASAVPALGDAAGEGLVAITRLTQEIPALVSRERRATLAEIDEQRVATLAALEGERKAVMTDLTRERESLVASVEEMRGKTLKELRGLVDHAFVRLLQLLVLVAVVSAVGLVMYFRHSRQRPVQHVGRERRPEEERRPPPPPS